MTLERLSRFEASEMPVLSVYVNRNPQTSSSRPLINELLKNPRHLDVGLGHDAAYSLKNDIAAITEMVERIDAERASAVALFSSHGAGLFEYLPLPRRAWDVSVVMSRPYLRPLRAVCRQGRVGAVIVDRRQAWVFVRTGDDLLQVDVIRSDDESKSSFGGFSGYDEHSSRNRAEELVLRHFREVAARLFSLNQQSPFSEIAVGGHEDSVPAFIEQLHPYLRDKLMGTFVIDPHTMSDSDVAKRVETIEADHRSTGQAKLSGDLVAAARGGGLAVLGLPNVIRAVNRSAASHLVIAGRFVKDGRICHACKLIDRVSEKCAACGGDSEFVEDVVGAAMEQVITSGGLATQIGIASPLDQDQIGAYLRFAV